MIDTTTFRHKDMMANCAPYREHFYRVMLAKDRVARAREERARRWLDGAEF